MSLIIKQRWCRPKNFAFWIRGLSSAPQQTFLFSDLEIHLKSDASKSKKPESKALLFGRNFTDHMLEIEWTLAEGWKRPVIKPVHELRIHPAAKVLHYATELFEGMKAYCTKDDRIILFRPDMNIARMLATAERSSLPIFDGNEFLKCLKKLVDIESDWVPKADGCSLYIRPTLIATEPTLGIASSNQALLYVILSPVGPYFATGYKPVSLLADPQFVRAWPGGCGDKKMGANYAPTIAIQRLAEKRGFQQILWLFGPDHQMTEVGTMNIFVHFINEKGERELVTPPLDGLILPGITRYSILDLCRELKQFKVTERVITMGETLKLLKDNKVLEIFGAGTACVVCPVNNIHFENKDYKIPTMEQNDPLWKRLLISLNDIQYGRIEHKWSVPVNDTDDKHSVSKQRVN